MTYPQNKYTGMVIVDAEEYNQIQKDNSKETYINFSKKFDELASDIDDIRELLMEVLQYNKDIMNEISHIWLPCNKAKKKKKSKSESD